MTLNILDHFHEIAPLSEDARTAIARTAQIRQVKVFAYFLKKWDVCKEIAFVESGMLHAGYESERKRMTQHPRSICPFDMCVSFNSLTNRRPSIESILAVKNTTLLCFDPAKLLKIVFRYAAIRTIFLQYLAKEVIERDSLLLGCRDVNGEPENIAYRKMYEEYLQQLPDADLCALLGTMDLKRPI